LEGVCSKLDSGSRILDFGGQVFEFEIGRQDQPGQRIVEKELIFAVVKPEAHFVKVRGEMLRGDSMPRTHNAALELLAANHL